MSLWARSMSEVVTQRVSRGVWISYFAGTFAYIAAVFGRTSFGVAAIPASERFHASASDVAIFTVVQLLVYAGLQIPVGVLIDRYGSRRLVLLGCALMVIGQAYLAFATSVTPALLARMLIGAGDAFIFSSVLRKVAQLFPPRQVPMLTQTTGLLGQIGQLLSAIPFAAMISVDHWTASFLGLAGFCALAGVLVFAFFRGGEDAATRSKELSPSEIGRQLATSWRHPGTKVGFWVHFTTPFSIQTFTMLWGYPFMTQGLGYRQATASFILSLNVLVAVTISPVLGRMVARHPLRRSTMVLGLVTLGIAAWTLVLAWPGRAPVWTVAFAVLATSLGGPGSMVGFDFARTFNPSSRLGTATGIVNVGGFVASLITMFAMGVILDWFGSGTRGDYSLAAYKWAFAFQYVVWALGIVMIIRYRNRTRRVLAGEGVVVPPLREAISRDWHRRQEQRHPETPATGPSDRDNPKPDWEI